jgi:NitT/TauT family transport system permease protein
VSAALRGGAALALVAAACAALALHLLHAGHRGAWLVPLVAVPALLAWAAMARLARDPALGARLVPAVFGAWVLFLWEAAVVGFEVPRVLLPAPSAIGHALAASTACWPPTSSRPSSARSCRGG